ncbi:hypothetical protein ACFGVR_05425 [Mucilaginibacter sp. AW1-3]
MKKLYTAITLLLCAPLFVFNGFAKAGSLKISGKDTTAKVDTVTHIIGTSADLSGAPKPKNLYVQLDNGTNGTALSSLIRINQTAATAGSIQGLEAYVKVKHPVGVVNLAYGLLGHIEQGSSSILTTARAVQGGIVYKGSGNTNSASSFYAFQSVDGGSGTITDAYLYYGNAFPKYGVSYSNKWGVYINDNTAKNYLPGPTNMGTLTLTTANGSTGDSLLTVHNGVVQKIPADTRVNGAYHLFTPVNKGSVALVNNSTNIINPPATIARLTLTLPPNAADNDRIKLKYTQTVTAITFSGGIVVGNPKTGTAGQMVELIYNAGTHCWY